MPQDNTLGAPTEGLGQTVTFAIGGQGSTPQATAVRRGQLRNNPTGGGAQRTAQALQIPESTGAVNTLRTLARFGEEIIKPHLEAERNRSFMQGMQQAAQGQAITEIVEDQPWYSKAFGSTSVVDGARAYTASAKAAASAAKIEGDMDNLRKLSASEFGAYTADLLTSSQTGDATTDMMLTQQISSTFPGVMKAQAKAHFRYQQEMMETAVGDNFDANFSRLGNSDLQARKPDTTKEQGDVLGDGIKVLESLVVPAGMQPERFNHILTQRAAKQIMQGNFAVGDLLESSGKLAELTADEQTHIRQATSKARQDAKMRLPLPFAERYAAWRSLSEEPSATKDSIAEEATAINLEYANLTGDRAAFLDVGAVALNLEQRTRFERQQLKAAEHLRDTASRVEGNKLAREEAEITYVGEVAAMLKTNSTMYLGSVKKDDMQKAWTALQRTSDPASFARTLAVQSAYGNVYEAGKDILQGNIATSFMGTGNPGKLYETYLTQYLPLVTAAGDSEVAARAYAGPHAELMTKYHKLAAAYGGQLDQTQRDTLYATLANPAPPAISAKREKEITQALGTSWITDAYRWTFNVDKVEPVRPKELARELDKSISPNLPIEQGIDDALRSDTTLTLLGGQHWRVPSNATRLDTWLINQQDGRVVESEKNRAAQHAFGLAATAAGIESVPSVFQIADNAGMPQMYLTGIGSDGKPKVALVSGREVAELWAARTASKQLTREDLSFGPLLTHPYEPKPGRPSIYSGFGF